ncbi:hypothetical protein NQ318_017802 [Aromia moschata]|uniref:Uncharacterized protein n=1 Tax=Aromia moschata TaxID=1265417 RepID=A0AAV8X2S3_9CUCU|nr:hypothetical protein NQ318_017802 [Aromia moschata]
MQSIASTSLKIKKIDAWDEIAEKRNDVNNVNLKMTSLLGSFRAQKSKGKKSIGTGKAWRQEIYVSNWFAFKRILQSFNKRTTNFGNHGRN